jgi:hypothetical protein
MQFDWLTQEKEGKLYCIVSYDMGASLLGTSSWNFCQSVREFKFPLFEMYEIKM